MNRLMFEVLHHQLTGRQLLVPTKYFASNYIVINKTYNFTQLSYSTKYPPIDYKNQSKIIAGTDIHISNLCPGDEPIGVSGNIGGCKTIYDIFQTGVQLSGDGPFLGWRPDKDEPYKWLSYNEVKARAKAFGDGLVELGFIPNNDTRIGIYSQNRKEVTIAELGMVHHSMCSVPIYSTVEEKNLMYIINHANLCTIVCDDNFKIEKLLQIRSEVPEMRTIITFEIVNNSNADKAKEAGINIVHINDVEKLGKNNPQPLNLPSPDDLAVVCFTSGTTGKPKGAMLSHTNILSTASATMTHHEYSGLSPISKDDCIISYLPVAHIYQRFLELGFMGRGARIGFFYGDIDRLPFDLQELKPTGLPAVPRLLNRIHDRVFAALQKNKLKLWMFKLGLYWKRMLLKRNITTRDTLPDRLIFNKVTDLVGGNVRVISTGSAPISNEVKTNLQCILGCPIIEGYGQTECAGCASYAFAGLDETGNVGPPGAHIMIKLVDVPEMNYFTENNQGEICLKGNSIFKGYLKDPEKDKEVFLDDGWLRTGDIGTWTESGCLKIIDRRKHIFKLSQGEFIAPEKIENVILQSPYVAQMFVHGDSFRDDIVCVAVPDKDGIESLQERLGIFGSYEEILLNEEIKQAILQNLQDLSKSFGLSPLETVRDVFLSKEDFTIENGLLTPTLKMRRQSARERFDKQLENMYNKINEEKRRFRESRKSMIDDSRFR